MEYFKRAPNQLIGASRFFLTDQTSEDDDPQFNATMHYFYKIILRKLFKLKAGRDDERFLNVERFGEKSQVT